MSILLYFALLLQHARTHTHIHTHTHMQTCGHTHTLALPPNAQGIGSKEDAGLEQEGASSGASARFPPSHPYGTRCARCRVLFLLLWKRKSAVHVRRVHLFAGCGPVPRTHGVLRRQDWYPESRQHQHRGASGRRLRQHGVMHVSLVCRKRGKGGEKGEEGEVIRWTKRTP